MDGQICCRIQFYRHLFSGYSKGALDIQLTVQEAVILLPSELISCKQLFFVTFMSENTRPICSSFFSSDCIMRYILFHLDVQMDCHFLLSTAYIASSSTW